MMKLGGGIWLRKLQLAGSRVAWLPASLPVHQLPPDNSSHPRVSQPVVLSPPGCLQEQKCLAEKALEPGLELPARVVLELAPPGLVLRSPQEV